MGQLHICLYTLLFFFLLRFGGPLFSLAQHLCHPHETLALLQFKEMLHTSDDDSLICSDDPYPKISSWKKGRDCCTWDGITCHETTGDVIGVDLSCSHLEGGISPNSSLFTLSRLEKLDLAKNNFKRSQISRGFGGFTRLTHLDLSYSNFSGQIASEISHLSKLILLDLSQSLDFLSNGDIDGSHRIRFGQHEFQLLLQNLTHVVSLSLYGVDISSEVPMNLSSSLSYLDLGLTGVYGKLPNDVFQLPNLQILGLYANQYLTGSLPEFNCSKSRLQKLALSSANFFGELPNSIGCLKSLEGLYLGNNNFSGPLPKSIGNLSKLNHLDLSFNNFIGRIPAMISKLLDLVLLDVSSNHLSGPVEPNTFSNLKELEYLDLSDNNMLIWRIDNDVTLSFLNLEHLGLSSCGLKEIPEFLRSSKNLGFLQLSNNNIRQISNWFTSMPWDSLYYLNFSHNSFSTLPLLPFKNLGYLDFRSNQLQSPLSISICNSEQLQILDFANNKLTGAIPQCFGNFSRELWVLDLKNNSLQGEIALTFATDCSLVFLDLNGNSLEGLLPRSLSNCEQLEVFDVGNNNISDTFPTWLEKLQELQILILKSNRFFGPIGTLKTKNPFEKLRVIDISSNEFIGVLPTRFLKSFYTMESMNINESKARYMEFNKEDYGYYQASIQLVMKGLEFEFTRILTILTTIDVSSNRFTGKIPKVIGNFISLKFLNLSHNRFSGHIPSILGNLDSLESLDISCNHIEGEIPWQLAQLTSLSFLNLSQNHLEGRIPQGLQFNTFFNDSYIGNLGLCGLPLTKSCGETEAPPQLPQLIDQQEEDSNFFSGFTWRPVILGYGFGIVFGLAAGSLMFLTGKPELLVGFIEKEIYYCGLLLLRKKGCINGLKGQLEEVTRSSTGGELTTDLIHMRDCEMDASIINFGF